MIRQNVILVALISSFFATPMFAEQAALPTPTIGTVAPEISLNDVGGKPWSLEGAADRPIIAIVFMGTECPLMQLYAPRLGRMATEFADRGVSFVGINSNQQDGLAEISAFARTHEITFPILKDPGNQVADRFGAARTPEVFVLDQQRRLCYHGAIDDQFHYGIQRDKADHNYLRDALTALADDKAIAVEETEVVGCQIGRILAPRGDSKITYSNQISRILQKRCVECHRDGEIAPFALTDYDEVVGWAGMIAEVVEQRRMPPWHADERYGHFANDARLTDVERNQIAAWVAAGAPEGDVSKLPPPRQFVEGWRIGTPDLVIPMADKAFAVPAEGVVPYKHFIVDPGFTEDKWIQSAECRIGNRAVVHHIIVAAVSRERGQQRPHGDLDSDWLAATAPGARPMILPQGLAKRIPAGSKLVFQMHYTPNGKPNEDLSSIGLIFADPDTVRHEVVTQKAANTRFRIGAGEPNHEVKAAFRFPQDSLMFAMFPHMHLRGKAFRYTAEYPDGKSEVLLDVPRYDFNWQNAYEFVEAKPMPAGTVLHCVAHFDNSADNPANPDPNRTVTWGDQTWDEMMIGYFDMALAAPISKDESPSISLTEKFLQDVAAGTVDTESLRKSASNALQSQASFRAWGENLRKTFPQITRADWMTVDAGKLTVQRVVETRPFNVAAAGLTVPAAQMHLAHIVSTGNVTTIPDTSDIKASDFRLMKRRFASSLHIPVERNSQPGVISFWSSEKEGFPTEAVTLLETLADALATSSDTPR